jgi:hypothetical protein
MAHNALGPIAEITQIRLCCVAGGVPVMNRPGASEAPDAGASSALNRTGRKSEGRLQHLPFVFRARQEAELASLYRERAIQRAQLAERDPTVPLQ